MFVEGKPLRKLILIKGIFLCNMCCSKESFVYHFSLMTSATVYVPSWLWGEHCIHSFIWILICSTDISGTFEAQVAWKENVNSLIFTFSPHPLTMSGSWDLASAPFSKTRLLEVVADFLPVLLLLIWLGFPAGSSSLDHLLPLGTICLRFIRCFSSGLFPIPLAEFSSKPSFQKQRLWDSLLSTICFSLTTLSLPERVHLLPPVSFSFIYPTWRNSHSFS